MSTEQWIFVFAGISAIADFLTILERAGLLKAELRENASEIGTALPSAKKGDWTFPIILFLITMGLSVYGFYRVSELEKSLAIMGQAIMRQVQVIVGIGTPGQLCSAVVNGVGLMEYAEKYNLVVVCGIADSAVDKYEDTRITVSTARTLSPPFQNNIEVSTPYSEKMGKAVKEIKDNILKNIPAPGRSKLEVTVPVWYEVAVVPKGVSPTEVTRLSDVHKYGGKLLSTER